MRDLQPRSISRRRFLKGLTIGAGAIGASAVFSRAHGAFPHSTAAAQRVLVLGAGLAGLAAAWELSDGGHEVTMLEARTRPGGRVLTLRESFADRLYAEAGAISFGDSYSAANRYINALRLKRASWVKTDLAPLYHLRGRRFAARAGETPPWPYDLTPEERKLGPTGIAQRYIVEKLPREIVRPDDWNRPPLVELDRLSLADFMRSNGANEEALALVRDTQWYGPKIMESSSALSAAVADFAPFASGGFVLDGGNDQLPAAMAERLARHILYGVEVFAIRDLGSGVEVLARRGVRTERHSADRIICTLPATVLRDISIEPALPDEQRAAIRGLQYGDVTRTYLQVRRAFWYDEGVTGSAATDLPVMQVTQHPVSDPGGPQKRAILESHVRGAPARRLAARSDHEIFKSVVESMTKVHPTLGENVEGGTVKAWSNDPYALAGYSLPAPGQVTRWLPLLQRPHGRIHFAGEHTSILRATMEGALRSGIRAAAEVVRAGGA